ncbi:MAG: NADH-dependent [FeFe] hydrogenase, group A6 [Fibrobacterales bacterium]
MSAPQNQIGGLIKVTIDGKEVRVPTGTTILMAAREVGIKIPTLCQHDDLELGGVCRVCVVEIEGMRTLQASCAFPINQEMTIRTQTQKVREARKHVVELLLSKHVGECYACERNGNCELRELADIHDIKEFTFGKKVERDFVVDDTAYSIVRDMDKCVLCRRCIRTCVDLQEVGAYEAFDKGSESYIGTFNDMPMDDVVCINCGQCVNRCPTAALTVKNAKRNVWDEIADPSKTVVIQTAPAPRAGIGEIFGLTPGTSMTYQMNTAIRKMGFDKVFDTNFSADLTIFEEGTELILRLFNALVAKKDDVALPQFTSCSPGWVKYLEHFYPEMIPNLSSAKSPQQMFGTVMKTYFAECNNLKPEEIVSVSLMPCSAKKYECDRPEMNDSGHKDVDYVLTTREMGKMIKEHGIHLPDEEKSDFDDPFGDATGSGVIFGTTGGVMEAAIRTVYELVTGEKIEDLFEKTNIVPLRGFEGIKYVELPIATVGPVPDILNQYLDNWDWLKGATLKVAIAHGTANAKKVLEDIKEGGKFSECHFIEFMACPGGCIGGGGQPIPTTEAVRKERMKAIYAEDESYAIRKSHENPAVHRIYAEFLTDGILGHKAHSLLHTHYTERGTDVL